MLTEQILIKFTKDQLAQIDKAYKKQLHKEDELITRNDFLRAIIFAALGVK